MQCRIIHITQPKSGSQWVRDVLTAPEIVTITGIKNARVSSEVSRDRSIPIPTGMFGGPLYDVNRLEWLGSKKRGDKVLVVIRDPRDLLVSLLFSLSYSHGKTKSVAGMRLDATRQHLLAMDMREEQLLWLLPTVGNMRRWYTSWAASGGDPARERVVKYEALINSQYREFGEIVDWLGWSVPESTLGSVVERLSFEARSGRKPGSQDIFSHYRNGTAGDWRNHFSRHVGEAFERSLPGVLAAAGYEEDGEWWKCLPDAVGVEATSQSEVAATTGMPGLIPTAAQTSLAILERRNAILEEELAMKESVISELSIAAADRLKLIDDYQHRQNNDQRPLVEVKYSSEQLLMLKSAIESLAESQSRVESALIGRSEDFEKQAVMDPYFLGWTKEDFVRVITEKEAVISEIKKAVSAYRAAHFLLSPRQATGHVLERIRGIMEPNLGKLRQHEPRPISIRKIRKLSSTSILPRIGIVTPSYQQGSYIKQTIESVLSQNYPNLQYVVQDGGSTDETIDVLKSFEGALSGWASAQDEGQSAALNIGFAKIDAEVMGYLNSDDLLLPGALLFVGEFFSRNPLVDVVYGDRLIINENGLEVGSWRLPRHDDNVLSWADYVPQETLFWRRAAWEKAGGAVDENLHFAMDWDLILRLRDTGAHFVHIPHFLGAFRVHNHQKTSAIMTSAGLAEMTKLRERCLGYQPTHEQISRALVPYLTAHVLADLPRRIATWLGNAS